MINRMRNAARSPLGAFCCLGLVLALTLPGASQAAPTRDTGHYDGRTLMRGILFGYGPVADLLPEVRGNYKLDEVITDPSQVSAMIVEFEQILREVDAIDPGFFERWAVEVQSGDHLRISAALGDASEMVLLAMAQSPDVQEALDKAQQDPEALAAAVESYNQEAPPEAQVELAEVDRAIDQMANSSTPYTPKASAVAAVVAAVWAALAIDLAVAVWHVAAVQTAAAITTVKWVWAASSFWGPRNRMRKSALQSEQLIQSIAERLQPQQ